MIGASGFFFNKNKNHRLRCFMILSKSQYGLVSPPYQDHRDFDQSLSDSTASLNHTLKAKAKTEHGENNSVGSKWAADPISHSTPKKPPKKQEEEEQDGVQQEEEEEEDDNLSTDISDAELSDFWDQVRGQPGNSLLSPLSHVAVVAAVVVATENVADMKASRFQWNCLLSLLLLQLL